MHRGEGRGEGWQEHRIGSYQEVGREFTSRIIKFYDEESVFPFVSWPPSLLRGSTVRGQLYIRNHPIVILRLTVHLCRFIRSLLTRQNEQRRGYARGTYTRHRQSVTFLPDILPLEISNRSSNGCLSRIHSNTRITCYVKIGTKESCELMTLMILSMIRISRVSWNRHDSLTNFQIVFLSCRTNTRIDTNS